jgi:hypothetical protein
VIGWTCNGDEVVLLPHQEQAVRDLLEGKSLREAQICWARGWGKSTVFHTVERLLEMKRLEDLDIFDEGFDD